MSIVPLSRHRITGKQGALASSRGLGRASGLMVPSGQWVVWPLPVKRALMQGGLPGVGINAGLARDPDYLCLHATHGGGVRKSS